MKKIIRIIMSCLLLGAGTFGAYFMYLFAPQFKAVQSIQSIAPDVYTMTYRGDYGFDAFLENGGATTDSAMAVYIGQFLTHGIIPMAEAEESSNEPFACSTLILPTDSGYVMGRNFDYEHHGQTMITRTFPKNGYASVATNSILFLGYGDSWQPAENPVMRMPAIAAIYVPLDGMNECGLCVADLIEVDGTPVHQSTGKTPITTVAAIRLILDHAANVDEAIALLQSYDLHSSMNAAHHFAISDATGKAVVVEYINHQMVVTPSMACTNHRLAMPTDTALLSPAIAPAIANAKARHQTLMQISEQPTADDLLMQSALQQVAFAGWTRWSIVFNPQQKTATYYFNADFTQPYTISLGDKSN